MFQPGQAGRCLQDWNRRIVEHGNPATESLQEASQPLLLQLCGAGLQDTSALQKKDTVEMTIGYHQLEGKIVVLNKPLAMLEKCCTGVGEEQKLGYQVGV